MRVLLVSHTYFPPEYRGKLRHLAARPGMELHLAAIPTMKTVNGTLHYENSDLDSYPQHFLPAAFQSHIVLRIYSPWELGRLLDTVRPHIVHVEAEPHSLALGEVTLLRAIRRFRVLFFAWENIDRRLPLPFQILERLNLSTADAAIAGSQGAAAVLRRHGFRRSVSVVPQVGVDLELCSAARPIQGLGDEHHGEPVIGFVGRLVPEKGVLDLLAAFARLSGSPHLLIVGGGPLRDELLTYAVRLGVAQRVHMVGNVSFRDVPSYLKRMSILALPSRTTAKWKEQFGHVLVEAMACGVPVIGSDSGAIPEVIADAGSVFPEGDVSAIHKCLERILDDASQRCELRARAIQRVRALYGDEAVAARTYAVYEQLIA